MEAFGLVILDALAAQLIVCLMNALEKKANMPPWRFALGDLSIPVFQIDSIGRSTPEQNE